MPFVRFSRDKRGYEHIYLVHTSQRRGRRRGTRVLYWFRTPPGVKVGREPFDAELRRTLEAQNPGVAFDWDRLSNTPIPPPESSTGASVVAPSGPPSRRARLKSSRTRRRVRRA